MPKTRLFTLVVLLPSSRVSHRYCKLPTKPSAGCGAKAAVTPGITCDVVTRCLIVEASAWSTARLRCTAASGSITCEYCQS